VSSLLIHGPGASLKAEKEAQVWGRLTKRFGEEGLKVDEAREIIVFVHQPPFYPDGKLPIALIGPMDGVTPQTQDVLLKSVEDSQDVGLILWAQDAGSVSGTIRSRCLTYWAPVSEFVVPELCEEAHSILMDLHSHRVAEALQTAMKFKEDTINLIDALSFEVKKDWDNFGKYWSQLRTASQVRNPTVMSLIQALVTK
jgi:hypothetical protein